MTDSEIRSLNRAKGRKGEQIAVNFLRSKGICIRQTNFYTRCGEIDIVGMDNGVLVFFEVKYRRGLENGSPLEAVNERKIRHIINAARFYLYRFGFSEDIPVRFDVIGIQGGNIEWIRSAFDCSGLNI